MSACLPHGKSINFIDVQKPKFLLNFCILKCNEKFSELWNREETRKYIKLQNTFKQDIFLTTIQKNVE